jgi:hypothetical protein
MIQGLLAICSKHGWPLRVCVSRHFQIDIPRLTPEIWRTYLLDTTGDRGCHFCGRIPAVFWARSEDGLCDCTDRVCDRHRDENVCYCRTERPLPGGCFGPLDEINPWQHNAIRCLEGDYER